MDVKAYIESGILEAYVLDTLDPKERAEVQAHISENPEIAAEVAAIENAMQAFAEAHAEAPPAFMQEKIWSAISDSSSVAADETHTTKENGHSRTIPFPATERRKQYRWANAAMLIALVGSLGVNIMFWSQKNDTEAQLATTKQHLESTQQQSATFIAQLEMYKQEKEMMADSNMTSIAMKSMKPGHPMVATIYWNRSKGEAYLSMQKLPKPEKGKQYQMWVIQKGVPVSMGVLPIEVAEGKMIPKFPMEIKEGEAFAISLENVGGNPTPTDVMVLGKVV